MGVVAEDSRPNHSSVSKRLKCQDYSPECNNATEVPAPLRPRQPLAWQEQAQPQPRSAEIVTSGSQPAVCSGHRLTSTGEIFAPSLRCCHHPDETSSECTLFTQLRTHASGGVSQCPTIAPPLCKPHSQGICWAL